VELSIGKGKSSVTITEVLAPINEDFLPTAKALEFPSKNGRTVHAFMSPATNPNFVSDELPPVIITVHGGPTGNTSGVASIKRAFLHPEALP
jgi:dipeptidyl aminopeptidase/acylaminoacyl peptidase